MSMILALVTAIGWGASDYFGGDSSRGVSPLIVVAAAELLGCLLLMPVLLLTAAPFPAEPRLLFAAATGISVTVELSLIYRAISDGLAFITAPVGVLGALGAVLVGVAGGEALGVGAAAGIACALVGGAISAWASPDSSRAGRVRWAEPAWRALLLCLGAAAAVATSLTFLHAAGKLNPVWVTAVEHARTAVSAGVAVLATSRRSDRRRRWGLPGSRNWKLSAVALSGTGGDLAYVAASKHGALGIVSAISSLYPVATIALGAALLAARPSRRQALGIVMALAGAALLGVTSR